MQKKYALPGSDEVDLVIDNMVKSLDKRDTLKNDLLQKSDVVFTYREDGNYNDLIMMFLNWLMTEIDTTP